MVAVGGGKADDPLIDNRDSQHFGAIERGDTRHETFGMFAASFYQLREPAASE